LMQAGPGADTWAFSAFFILITGPDTVITGYTVRPRSSQQ
jgi:hypothetical protein